MSPGLGTYMGEGMPPRTHELVFPRILVHLYNVSGGNLSKNRRLTADIATYLKLVKIALKQQ